jgi:hypothetical protein
MKEGPEQDQNVHQRLMVGNHDVNFFSVVIFFPLGPHRPIGVGP